MFWHSVTSLIAVTEGVPSSFAECKLLRRFLSEGAVSSPLALNLWTLSTRGQKLTQIIKKCCWYL